MLRGLAASLIILLLVAPAGVARAQASSKACSDGIDNDGDEYTDYPSDPGCTSANDKDESNAPALAVCNDGSDNDADGVADYPSDPGCSSANDSNERGSAACDDAADNDGDGYRDFPADEGCSGPSDTDERTACQDGDDNDGDWRYDFPSDFGCSSAQDNDERGITACDDGVDNDGDGAADHPADLGCMNPEDTDETDPAPTYLYLHAVNRFGKDEPLLNQPNPLPQNTMDTTPPTSEISATSLDYGHWEGPLVTGYREATLTIWATQTTNGLDPERPLEANLIGVRPLPGYTYAFARLYPVDGTITPAGTVLVRYEGTFAFSGDPYWDDHLDLHVHGTSVETAFHYDSIDAPACLAFGTMSPCP